MYRVERNTQDSLIVTATSWKQSIELAVMIVAMTGFGFYYTRVEFGLGVMVVGIGWLVGGVGLLAVTERSVLNFDRISGRVTLYRTTLLGKSRVSAPIADIREVRREESQGYRRRVHHALLVLDRPAGRRIRVAHGGAPNRDEVAETVYAINEWLKRSSPP